DGIRDRNVTGVQTCALPISITNTIREWNPTTGGNWSYVSTDDNGEYRFFGSFHEVRENERIVQTFTFEGFPDAVSLETMTLTDRSEERRVGKECRAQRATSA